MDGSQQPQQSGGWQFQPNEGVDAQAPAQPSEGVTWTASEFIAHEKSASWYLLLALGATAAAALVWLLTRDWLSAGMIIVAAWAFGVMATRKPREQTYRLDAHGITIGNRRYDYEAFRSYSIVKEGAFPSIEFIPLKRFALLVTMHYDPSDEAAIMEILSAQLPYEERGRDPLDRLMWRIRF